MARLDILKLMAHGLAEQFGTSCEVVIHDVRAAEMNNTVVHIENGDISKREIGAGPSHAVLEAIKNDDGQVSGKFSYLTRTKDGRILKSSTMYIRDDNGRLEYLFCINYEITDFITLQNSLDRIIHSSSPNGPRPERITTSVEDLLDDLLAQAEELVGRPAHLMNKQERLVAIKYLNEHGAFLITKASEKIADTYNISKFTLYSDLNTVKEQEMEG